MKASKTPLVLLMMLCYSFALFGTEYIEIPADHIAPDFIASFYDYYTVNYLNARLLSMGGTAVAQVGGIENSLANPASFRGGKFSLYFEGLAKSSVREMNTYHEAEGLTKTGERQKLESGIPSGMFGFGFSPLPEMSVGASVSIPQTIRYNLVERRLPTGAYVDRFPSMNNYQTTLSLAGHYEPFNVGLNIMYNYFTFRDLRLIAPHFDRVRFNHGLVRIQPGVLYEGRNLTLGASYTLSADETIKMGNQEPYYEIYDTHFPAVLETGLSYKYSDDITIALAFEYEQTSKQYSGFDDRFIVKAGLAKNFDDFDLKAGFISMPGIYTGNFAIPEDPITEGDFIFDPLPYDYGVVQKTDQLLFTGGFTYYLRDFDVSMAFAKDLLQNIDLFQVLFSVEIKLGEVISRGKPQ